MGLLGKILNGVENDAKGLIDPRNYYRAGKMAVTHPLGFAENVGKSYLNLAEHPIRNFENHPLSSLLAVAPIGGGLGKLASIGAKTEAAGRLGASFSTFAKEAPGFYKGEIKNTFYPGDENSVAALIREKLSSRRLDNFGNKSGVGYLNEAIKRPNVLTGAIERAQGARLLKAEPEASPIIKDAATKGYTEPQSFGIAGMGAPGPHVPPSGDFRVGLQIFRNPNDSRWGLDLNDMKSRPYQAKPPFLNEGPASKADILSRDFHLGMPPKAPTHGESFSDAPVWTPPWDVESPSQSLERGSIGPFHPPKEDILDNRAIPRDRAMQLLKQLMEERKRGAEGYTGGRRRWQNGFGNMN